MSETETLTEAELVMLHAGDPSAMADTDLQRRLAADPQARAMLEEWKRQDAALNDIFGPVAEEPVPERFRDIVRSNRRWQPALSLRMAALAGALLIGGAGGWWLARASAPDIAAVMLASAAQQAHATFVVEVRHPVEVAASDSGHLTTWLSKRINHGLNLPDFSIFGFQLMGGRVVPSDKGPAALLMYEDDRGRRITLFVENGGSTETAMLFTAGDKVGTYSWVDEGLGCALTGDLPREELRAIARAAYDQLI